MMSMVLCDVSYLLHLQVGYKDWTQVVRLKPQGPLPTKWLLQPSDSQSLLELFAMLLVY